MLPGEPAEILKSTLRHDKLEPRAAATGATIGILVLLGLLAWGAVGVVVALVVIGWNAL